jgi:hypothetical protein
LWLAYGDAPRWQVMAASLFACAMGTVYFYQAYGVFLLPYAIVILVGNGLLLGASVLLAGQALRKRAPMDALFIFPAGFRPTVHGVRSDIRKSTGLPRSRWRRSPESMVLPSSCACSPTRSRWH